MTDYNNLKVQDLKKLLQDRSLPVSGKKEDLIARLQEHDSKAASEAPAAASTSAAQEDEIDWDDDTTAPQAAAEATTEPAAAAIAAGGKGQVANPTAVPNQQQDVDPASTNDLKVAPPADASNTETTQTKEPTTGATEGAKEKAKPAVDFSKGLAATDIEKELAARKRRAEKFGITESTEDALKALERAKRFGTGTDGEHKAIQGLDEALPERRERKRGRDAGDVGGRGRGGFKRGRGGRDRFRGRRGGGGGGGRREEGGKPEATSKFSEEDRKKAEARAKRFAAAA